MGFQVLNLQLLQIVGIEAVMIFYLRWIILVFLFYFSSMYVYVALQIL
jgi:hypothetical protein